MTTPVLFEAGGLAARELQADEVPALQALWTANPGYWRRINGRPPGPDEAQVEFDELPPPELGFTRRWFCALQDADGALHGVLVLVADLSAPGVWHVALLWLEDALHGTGAAHPLMDACERWAAAQGARWLRLGVVRGNTPAERFWARRGLVETRVRAGVDTGGRVNDVRVLVKPLAADPAPSLDAYRALVPRDRPDSTLP